MTFFKKTLPLIWVLMPGLFLQSQAQEFEDFVSAYTSEHGQAYLQPLGDVIGSDLNSAFFHSAYIPRMKFTLDIGLQTMTTFIQDKDKVFMANTGDFFQPQTTTEAPTVFGNTRSVKVNGDGGTSYTFPGGIDINKLPLAVPQLRIGAVFGTDFTFRYFAIDMEDELGSLNHFGFGVRHSISQYLNDKYPVELAIGYYNQNLDLENFSETTANLVNLQGSYEAGILVLYGGLGYMSSGTDISYTYTDGEVDETIDIQLENTSGIRGNIGLALELGIFYLNSAYNLGSENTLVLGLGFSFGH